MTILTQVLDERWPTVPTWERYARPTERPAVNRWGDTVDDQRRRRKALLAAMREADER